METLKINLEENSTKENEKVREIKFDFYENKYFYIDDNNQKKYLKENEEK